MILGDWDLFVTSIWHYPRGYLKHTVCEDLISTRKCQCGAEIPGALLLHRAFKLAGWEYETVETQTIPPLA